MISISFIGVMAFVFYKLAERHSKLAWLFGAVGGFLAWLFMTLSTFIVVFLAPNTLTSVSSVVAGFKLVFMSCALAAFFCWLVYGLLSYLWKREAEQLNNSGTDFLDEEL